MPGLLRRKRSQTPGPALPRIVIQAFAALTVLIVVLIAALGSTAYGAYAQIAASLTPRLAALENRQLFQTSRILDRNGTLLYEFFDAGRRTKVDISEISPLLINATVAIEDKTFFTNPGVDIEGIARTIIDSLRAGEETGGASTITQQLIKEVVLTDEERLYENRYERKLKEIILAQELNERYDKNEILELYLNQIFYGNLAYGIEAASNTFFKTSAKDLTLAQASLLAGLPQSPSRYNPINYLERDEQGGYLPGVPLDDGWLSPSYQLPRDTPLPRWRQIAVLRQMVDEGYATEAEARAAAETDLRFAPQEVPLNAPHFVFYVRDLLEERYGQQLLNGGLTITTTLDLDIQRMAQQKAADRINELQARNIHNAAVVVMQPNTGQILAMVGSIDYNAVEPSTTPGETGNVLDGQVNVATRERQPGSALKPFTYMAAMESGKLTPASVLWDVPTEFPLSGGQWYAPLNYNQRWNGPVRIRTALANSLNMPAVKALRLAGIDYTLNFLDRMGIKNGLKRGSGFYGLSLTLGGGEVTPLELTTAYNTLASSGRYYPPVSILEITDSNGQVLESYTPELGVQVVSPELTAIMNDMLSDDKARAAIWGLNSPLKLSRPAAVKTGTTNDWRDAWAVGYTPYLTVGVWTGNNNNETTAKVESLTGGGIIWRTVMEELFTWMDTQPKYRDLFAAPFPDRQLPLEFKLPDNGSVVRHSICTLPGAFGGYNEELFTKSMVSDDGTPTAVVAPTTGTIRVQFDKFCDAYRKLTVVALPENAAGQLPVATGAETDALASQRFCVPANGQTPPPESLREIYIWNIPPPDPDVKVQYRWSWGSANAASTLLSARAGEVPVCTDEMLASFAPQPPMPGAVLMPDLRRLGENQAKEVLARLGVTSVYVDYQGREKLGDLYDQYVPYAVVSSIPAVDEWLLPGTTVILGIRAPDPDPQPQPQPEEPAQPAPEVTPTPQTDTPIQPVPTSIVPLLPPELQP